MKCVLCGRATGPGQEIAIVKPSEVGKSAADLGRERLYNERLVVDGEQLIDVHADCARRYRQHTGTMPHTYTVYLTTTQTLHQEVRITSDAAFTVEKLVELAVTRARDGEWEAGETDPDIAVDEIKDGGRLIAFHPGI
jgi:hypothetical protein